tara:strand:+ start:1131 stop:1301 length:171 start_codon:yes stop_codon:yes gene_type:complete
LSDGFVVWKLTSDSRSSCKTQEVAGVVKAREGGTAAASKVEVSAVEATARRVEASD